MAGPTNPVEASFPIPPPVPSLPFIEVGPGGQLLLTPSAFEFLQKLWAAIQGQGGIIDEIDDGTGGISVGNVNANVLALLAGQGAALTHLVPHPNLAALRQGTEEAMLLARQPTPLQKPEQPVTVLNEVPAGAVDGVNTTFTLANPPTTAGIALFLNGLLQKPVVDYALAGVTITMVVAPLATDLLLANYSR